MEIICRSITLSRDSAQKNAQLDKVLTVKKTRKSLQSGL